MRIDARIGAIGLAALLLTSCGDPTDDPDTGDEPGENEAAPEEPVDTDVDRDEERERAEAWLGTPEDEIEESGEARIVRRGDEDLPVTMDLRPGRHNLELDDEGEGYVVTRVAVEMPDDEDELVVE